MVSERVLTQIEKDIFDYTGGLALSLLPLNLVVLAGYLKLSSHLSLLLNWLECWKLLSGYGEQIVKGYNRLASLVQLPIHHISWLLDSGQLPRSTNQQGSLLLQCTHDDSWCYY